MEVVDTPEPIRLDPKGEVRALYEKRRAFIENAFMSQPADIHEVREGEARFRTISNACDLTQFSAYEEHHPLRVSVYVPGLFAADPTNTGNRMEHRLAAGVLPLEAEKGPHLIVILKTEGLNDAAYQSAGSEKPVGLVQTKTSQVSADRLAEILAQFKQEKGIEADTSVEFDIAGYSEGSSQAISLAARISESSMGSVERVISVGGAGLVGYEDQNQAHPAAYTARAFVESLFTGRGDSRAVRKESENEVYIGRKVIGGRRDGLEHSVAPPVEKRQIFYGTGAEQIKAGDDIRNISSFGERLVRTITGNAEEGMEVPYSRLQAVCTINPDSVFLADKHIPMIVFSGTKDQFFPNRLVRKYIKTLRSKHKGDIRLITSNTDHAGPHFNASALGYIFQLLNTQR